LSDRATISARAAKGFRPGGPNVLPLNAPANTPRSFGSDSIIGYEIGLKAETPDRSFAIDIAAFHIDRSDIQLFAQANGYGINDNGGKATSDGVEFLVTMRPVPGFTASVNGAYTDAKLTEDTSPLVGGFDGDRLPATPEWSIATNLDYDWALSSGAEAYVGASVRLVSDQPGNFSPAYLASRGRQAELDGYQVVDLRAGVDVGRFSVELYAKNLLNSHAQTNVSIASTYPAQTEYPGGAIGATILRPRTIGVSVGAGF